MNRSVAIAYAVASAATAIALVVIVGSTIGFGEAFGDDDDDDRPVSTVPARASADPRELANAANVQSAVGRTAPEVVSSEPVVVYEDAPARSRAWHEEEEGEEEEEYEHRGRSARGFRDDD